MANPSTAPRLGGRVGYEQTHPVREAAAVIGDLDVFIDDRGRVFMPTLLWHIAHIDPRTCESRGHRRVTLLRLPSGSYDLVPSAADRRGFCGLSELSSGDIAVMMDAEALRNGTFDWGGVVRDFTG
jgi:hypothetical protein